ncbi:MAG: hypothetical protein DMF95_11820 [Acidobacteria bacterium]|nr:MAG: hypothetical protein DMF95_11820 [Acidobacteriota bacterium]
MNRPDKDSSQNVARLRRLIATVAISLVFAPIGRAQSLPAPRTTPLTIKGRVVADDTGDPIPNVRVTATPLTAGAQVVLTDGEGRFTLTASAPARRIEASKTGYATHSALPLLDGAPFEIRLRRAAAIAGRIADAYGQPVVDARVVIEQAAAMSPDAPKVSKSVETDDHGEYRAGGFAAGDFVVSVMTIDANATVRGAAPRMVFSTATQKRYFPGTATLADARLVHVDFGEERGNVDIVVVGDQSGGQPFGIFGGRPGTTIHDHPKIDPAAIRGQVVDDENRGVPYAFVRLFPQGMPYALRAIRAESDGRFEFADLAAGTFRVTASAAGYAPIDGAPVLPGLPVLGSGPTVTVSAAQARESVKIRMKHLATIAGRVLDERGDPVEGARVQLLTVQYQAGRRRLVDAGLAARATNDRGEYRLHDVPQGRYIVSVSIGAVGTADVPEYTRMYFPGSTNPAEAQFVTLAQGDRVGVDVPLARTRTALVSGHIYSADGEPSTGGHVELRPSARSTSAAVSIPVGARILPGGAFEFPNVPPGEYIVEADRGRSNQSAEGEFGTTLVTVVDTDVTNIVVQMSAGSSIAGRFTFDTNESTKRPMRSAVELSAVGVDPDHTPSRVASAAVGDDWTFAMTGINGPRRLDLVRVPPEWMLKEVRVHDIDVTDYPIAFGRKDQSLTDVEVVLTDRISRITGRIVDENGHPAVGAHVIMFSTDRARWYPSSRFLRETATAPDGVFGVTGLPSGSFFVTCVERLPAEGDEAWQDPAYLETLVARSRMVTMIEGQKQALNLRLSPR